jgi:lysophospholipase L1-like esterase
MLYWPLLPVALVQGLWLRRTAIRLPPAAGPSTGAEGHGAPLRLLAVGDSIIAGVGLESTRETLPVQFAGALASRYGLSVHWLLEGENGAAVADLPLMLQAQQAATVPDIVLVSIGVNDVTGLTTLGGWRSGLERSLDAVRRRWPGACVVLLGLPPMAHFPLLRGPLRLTLGWRAAMLDQAGKKTIRERGRMYHLESRIDADRHGFCRDGFHPAADACKLWAGEMLRYLGERDGFRNCIDAADRRAG